MANDGEWRTGQYLVEGVKAIKCFHPRMLAPLMARVNTINPRLTKPFFVTRLTKRGVVTTPSLDFPNRTPYEIDFGINR